MKAGGGGGGGAYKGVTNKSRLKCTDRYKRCVGVGLKRNRVAFPSASFSM